VQTTGTAGSRFARDDKDQDWDPSWEKSDYPESGLSKLLRRDARVISPAGMFGGKGIAPLSGAEEQTARAISAFAQRASLISLQMGDMN
jgi:hypothetical protein